MEVHDLCSLCYCVKQEKHNVQLSLMLDTLWSKVFSVCVLAC